MDDLLKIPKSAIKSDILQEGIIILDAAGSIREFNETASRLLDHKPELFLKGPFIKADGSSLADVDFPWTRSLTGNETESAEIGFCGLSEVIWFRVNAVPLKNSFDQVTGILVKLTSKAPPDYDEVLLNTQMKYSTLFENLTSEVHVWKLVRDETGEIKTWRAAYINPPALKTWGMSSVEQVRGKTPEEMFGPGSTDHYMPVVQKIFREGVPYNYEDYFPNLDKYFHFTSIPLGEYFITTGSDISGIKKMQKSLERQFTELKAVFDSTHDSIIVYNMAGEVVFINRTFLELSKLGDQEYITDARSLAENFEIRKLNGDLLPLSDWPVQRVLKGETINDEPYKVIVKNSGLEVYLSFNGSPVFDADGKQILAATVTRNITQQTQTELALKESEARFRMLADNISPLVWIIDEHGENFWVNKRFIDYTGLTSEDLKQTGGASSHHPDYFKKAQEKFLDAIQKGVPYEDTFPLRSKDGTYRWFLTNAVPIRDEEGNIRQWFGTNTDITDQLELLEELKESHIKSNQAEKLAHLGSFINNLETRIVDASEEFWKIFEIVPEKNKAPWETVVSKIHPDDFKRISESAEINNPDKPFETELRLVMNDGSEKFIYLYDAAEADTSGNIKKRYGAVMDITVRKNAESKLRNALSKLKESETKLLNAQKIAKMGNVEIDLKSGEIFWSPEVYQIYEHPMSSGQPVVEEIIKYIHPEDRERILKAVQSVPDGEVINLEYRLLLSGGRIKYLNYTMTPIFESGIQVKRIGTIQDITERKTMELNLQSTLQSLHEKIAEKETLLKELYHRTKNNMQVISSLLNLKASAISNETDRDVFLEMKNRIQAMSLVHEMLYRNKNISRLNLGIYIKDVSEMLLRSHIDQNANITASFDLADIEVPLDLAMPCGFVVTELVLNVIKHAFPGKRKGNLSIILRSGKDKAIILSISDDGVGMVDSDLEDNIGLELTKTIVEDQLDGEIILDNSKGTSWTITFLDKNEERIFPVNF